jgi:3-hydroxyisobutyryl-CoA hydrolase
LTLGNKINCEDALYCGFLTHSVKNKSEFDKLKIKFFNIKEIKEIDGLLETQIVSNSFIQKNILEINSIFSEDSVETIMKKCKIINSEFSLKTFEILSQKCPYSLKVTFHLIHHTTNLNLSELLELEVNLSLKMGSRYDFKEGVRAVLVDKDNSPQWKPRTLEEVSDEEIKKLLNKS